MIRLLFVILAILVAGCGTPKQYMLSSANISKAKAKSMQIGVDKVEVPSYLQENRIPIKISNAQMKYSDAIWAVDPSKALTQILISSLQKRFSNPNVYLYPWDIEKESGKRVKLRISKFIYDGKNVVLEASYFIQPIAGGAKRSYLFGTKVTSDDDTASIIKSMNRAYTKLIIAISHRI